MERWILGSNAFGVYSGLRNIEPHFASGRVTSLSFYQVAYELISEVYVAVVQHIDDNPFYSDATLLRAKRFVRGSVSLFFIFWPLTCSTSVHSLTHFCSLDQHAIVRRQIRANWLRRGAKEA